MRYLVLVFVAIAALGYAQVWNGRTQTPTIHLKYGTEENYNRNLDKIDEAFRVRPTTSTTTTTTVTTTTVTTTTAAPTTTTTSSTTTTT